MSLLNDSDGKIQIVEVEGPWNIAAKKNIDTINKGVHSGKHVFLFLFMVGCNPCNMTKEPWSQIHHHLSEEHKKNPDIIIARVDKDFYPKLKQVGKEPMGFPTLRYIRNGDVEEYEDAPLSKKDRSAESFADWIKIKVKPIKRGGGFASHLPAIKMKKMKAGMNIVPKRRAGGTRSHHWSAKYKRSINCRRPRGFSQRQYCHYGRNKTKRSSRKHNR